MADTFDARNRAELDQWVAQLDEPPSAPRVSPAEQDRQRDLFLAQQWDVLQLALHRRHAAGRA